MNDLDNRKFFERLIASDNKINEAIFVGVLLIIPFLFAFFKTGFDLEKFKFVGNMILLCFGIGGGKAVLSTAVSKKQEEPKPSGK